MKFETLELGRAFGSLFGLLEARVRKCRVSCAGYASHVIEPHEVLEEGR